MSHGAALRVKNCPKSVHLFIVFEYVYIDSIDLRKQSQKKTETITNLYSSLFLNKDRENRIKKSHR